MPDKKIKCRYCPNEFIWTEREQKFYAIQKFIEPKRCPDCRKKKKEEKMRLESTYKKQEE